MCDTRGVKADYGKIGGEEGYGRDTGMKVGQSADARRGGGNGD